MTTCICGRPAGHLSQPHTLQPERFKTFAEWLRKYRADIGVKPATDAEAAGAFDAIEDFWNWSKHD